MPFLGQSQGEGRGIVGACGIGNGLQDGERPGGVWRMRRKEAGRVATETACMLKPGQIHNRREQYKHGSQCGDRHYNRVHLFYNKTPRIVLLYFLHMANTHVKIRV